MSARQEELQAIAPVLNQLTVDPGARVHYELMSDALIWSDELPLPNERNGDVFHCARATLRFRTTLILGEPDERYRADWEQLSNLCPHWPGCLPERRQPDPSRIQMFKEAHSRSIRAWEELDAKYERDRRAHADTLMAKK